MRSLPDGTGTTTKTSDPATDPDIEKAKELIDGERWDEVDAVVSRARKGDLAALGVLRGILAIRPYTLTIDLFKTTESLILKRLAGTDLCVLECARAETKALRKKLAGPDPSPLETLLIDRILLCRLHLIYEESRYEELYGTLTWLAQAEYEKSIDRSQKRYLAAIKALAQVRRLALPVVQLNIGEKQLNVAAGGVSGLNGNS